MWKQSHLHSYLHTKQAKCTTHHEECIGRVLISLSQAVSLQVDQPMKSVTHSQCDSRWYHHLLTGTKLYCLVTVATCPRLIPENGKAGSRTSDFLSHKSNAVTTAPPGYTHLHTALTVTVSRVGYVEIVKRQRLVLLVNVRISLQVVCVAFSALTLLVGRQEGHLACKKQWWSAGVVVCLEQGADLHMVQLMPMPLTVTCFSKIQIGFTFLVPAHLGSLGKRAVIRVCVCCV